MFVDIGNSRIKWALGEAGGIKHSTAREYNPGNLPALLREHWNALPRPERVLIANVAGKKAADILVKMCGELWSLDPGFMRVGKEACGLINGYQDINQLGVDRWLSMVAAWAQCHANVCVVGCGTAVTIDLVLANGRHLGGYIVPGTRMMQSMLTQNTQGINIESRDTGGTGPGQSTPICASNGSTLAVVALIDRVASVFRKQCAGETEYIITGGGAIHILPLLAPGFKYEPDLVLRGISIIPEAMTA